MDAIKSYISIEKVIFSLFAVVLSACGGGSADTNDKGDENTGISGSGSPVQIASLGSIDGFGSVILNDVKYETDNTTFHIDDMPGVQDDLKVGQAIRLNGLINQDDNTGVANEIFFYNNVIGPIQSIDSSTSKIVVLGQTVIVDTITIFGQGIHAFIDLQTNQIVKVSGFVNSQREIVASYIGLADATVSDYQVLGLVENLNETALTFSIGSLSIDYASANVTSALANGLEVKINGQLNTSSVLLANTISIPTTGLNENKRVDIEGLITRYQSATDFDVSGIRVTIDSNTVIENGGLDDLNLDARVEIEGNIDEQGAIKAERISLIHTGPLSFKGSVYTKQYVSHTFQTSELDKNLWVTLEVEGHANFFVERLENGRYIKECDRWVLNEFNNGTCYLENNGETNWRVRILGASNDLTKEEISSNYQLTAYFRRVNDVIVKKVNAGEAIEVYQNAGERSLYQISTANAPEGSFLAVTADGLQNSGILYIKGDAKPAGSTEYLFDCILKNDSVPINRHIRRRCWLDNNDADNWYLSLQSVANQQFTIHVDFVVPTELNHGLAISDTMNSVHGMLYKYEVNNNDTSIGVLLSQLSDSADLHLRKGQPPKYGYFDCAKGYSWSLDKQCILQVDEDATWYALVSTDMGVTYDLVANANDQTVGVHDLALGEMIDVHPAAAEITTYRIPKGSRENAFFVGITDHDDAIFDLMVKRNYEDGDRESACRIFRPNHVFSTTRHCRLLNDGDNEYWYVTVKSAISGRYTLWTTDQQAIDLNLGEEKRVKMPIDRPQEGILYRVMLDNSYNRFFVTIKDKTGLARILTRLNEAPSFSKNDCNDVTRRRHDEICSSDKNDLGYWYILIDTDKDTEFTIHTEVE